MFTSYQKSRSIISSFTLSFAAAAAKSLQSCPTLCDPIDGNPPGSPVPGILQARTLEWAAISFSKGFSQPRNQTRVSCIAGRFFTACATPEVPEKKSYIRITLLFSPAAAAAKSLQPCPTLGDPIDGSPPGSPVPGILQARTLEWVAISFSSA